MRRLSTADGTFDQLIEQWEAECSEFDEQLAGYATPHIDHARRICSEDPPDNRYGIYALEADGRFTCLMHANIARLPGTTGLTLRLLWVLLAPRFDFGEFDAQSFAQLAAGLLHGAIDNARQVGATAIKLQLTGVGDHTYFRGVAAGVGAETGMVLKVQGNWLHISGY